MLSATLLTSCGHRAKTNEAAKAEAEAVAAETLNCPTCKVIH